MTIQDILSRLEGVKGGGDQWTACCPAHGDAHQSLSVGIGKDGRVLLCCHAGCDTEDIVRAMGLQMKDLFVEDKPPDRSRSPAGKSPVVATYNYLNDDGKLLAQKLRKADKSFIWRRPDGKGGWIYNRQGVPRRLFRVGELGKVVYVVEGEKDAINLHENIGGCAVSGADGAGPGKWRGEYTEQLWDRSVVILQDNDDVGRAYANEVAAALHSIAKSVKLLDLSTVWPDIPEHGDISDMIETLGADEAARRLVELVRATPEWEPDREVEKIAQSAGKYPPGSTEKGRALNWDGTAEGESSAANGIDQLLSLFKPLSEYQEEEAEWIVPGWIPKGQISLIAADGGIGKTTLWCHVIAALSNGSTCILDPPGFTRQPMKVTFMTTEDSVRKKLRKKLRLAGANMDNIITPDFAQDRSGLLRKLNFGTAEMDMVLRRLNPVLCIFDPVQGFTPPKVNMGSRNEMRDCMAPLISIGEDIGTTALIVCHTNKRKGAYGRDRIADSADLWDISRSVMMAGFTDDQGVRYLSNEKNNYATLQETILFTIDSDEQIHKVGTSWKRDREYIQGAEISRTAPVREDCKAFILKTLEDADGAMPTATLEEKAKNAGYSFAAMKRAKKELKAEGSINFFQTGSAKSGDKVWHTRVVNSNGFVEVSEDEATPFDETAPV